MSGAYHSDLAGKSALVTGAASGIGLACAEALARAGAKVHLADIDDAVEKAAADVNGIAHVADLTDARAIETLPAEIDILVNNAGFQHIAPIHEFPPETFARIQALMVTAPFLLIRRVLPWMYDRGRGRVINMSSVHGLRASPFKSAYVTAKHALEGLSKVTALEGAEHGVTSNCVNPGYVRTPLVTGQLQAQAEEHGLERDAVIEQVLLRRSAIKRLIEPEDVAACVLWLSGDHTAHVTGTSIPLDGGWTAA
ncbi:3-hydroxybutyrate dehydrogenase [Amycolatopsis oliviviridis]|uniref:3-hydroxybutyrate dehydrogenase n=1 Tax=Amycolatopsis oliviviridis TaxID=1471590 RepID=A0ABQ3LTS6_9PSEU|nr:3-hydroxybutyrate dehydrogenase [Amycolatopsis oliviviridis]GHH23839.1 3-hydroxybutyrate dehydrogenase [Amycolatopsis oliviviridis]